MSLSLVTSPFQGVLEGAEKEGTIEFAKRKKEGRAVGESMKKESTGLVVAGLSPSKKQPLSTKRSGVRRRGPVDNCKRTRAKSFLLQRIRHKAQLVH